MEADKERIRPWTQGIVAGLLLLNVVLLCVFYERHPSANPESRLATIDSLVHRGTFRIDHSPYCRTPDKVQIDGHYYSSKPPLLPVVGVVPYWLYHRITGETFVSNEPGALFWIALVTVILPHIVLLLFFFLLLRHWVRHDMARLIAFSCLALGFIGLGYARGINNHTPAATALLVCFYYCYLIRRNIADTPGHWFLAGLFAGLAPTLEVWAGLFSGAFMFYLLTLHPRKTVCRFIPASVVFVALSLFLTYLSTGSVVPVYFRKGLYFYDGSYWLNMTGIDALWEPKGVYFFHLLFGHHGIFAMTPALLFGAFELIRVLVKREARRPEALTIGIPLALVIFALGVKTRNYGGICLGPRWLLEAVPLLMLFTASWLDRMHRRTLWILFWLCFIIGIAQATDSLRGIWRHSTWHLLFEKAGIGSLDTRQ
ncbi:MAG: hypothetical protein EOM20_00110 [Spartobacteria bacterium]|nr:hypothetical protein [Spartobacteria bacterium]